MDSDTEMADATTPTSHASNEVKMRESKRSHKPTVMETDVAFGVTNILSSSWPQALNTKENASVPYAHITRDMKCALYTGKGNHSNDFGTVRSCNPVPTDVEVYYFEVAVQDAGSEGLITIGLSPRDFNLSRQVGSRSG